jgi:hypothetical protein
MSRHALKDRQIQPVDDDDIDVDLPSSNSFFGSHINLIPLQSAVQGPRLFYGARFFNQALPVVKPEAPLVQNLIDGDQEGRSFDEFFGRHAGALRSHEHGVVTDVSPDAITYKDKNGSPQTHSLYNAFPFNRKTAITQTPLVKAGDSIAPGSLLAKSNYTDEKGTLALGLNARVGLLPYKGHSMDDAIVISEPFAKRLTSDHSYTMQQDFDHEVKGGLHHYISLFPTNFTQTQLKNLDEHGVVHKGTVVNEGDPLILATKPKAISSTSTQLSHLSKSMRQARSDGAKVWDDPEPGIVTDVVKNKKNVKLVISTQQATKTGDKIVFRSGQKGVVSLILPEAHMPRTSDGEPLEVLANHLGIPSRVNDSLVYETLLGKVAKKTGQIVKTPSFTAPGEHWFNTVEQKLKEAGLKSKEDLFDPVENRKLENPVTVGNAYILKLHHTAMSKASSRGQAGYDCYSEDSEVLTARGWVPWPEAKKDDNFFTVINGQACHRKATQVVSYDFDGELLGFESKYLDWLTTPNHEHLIRQEGGWKKISADVLTGKNRFSVKQFGFGKLSGVSPDAVEIPAPVFTQRKRRNKTWEGARIAIADYAEFIGWWISDGSVVFDETKNRYRVYIWQHESANPEKSLQIRELLDRLPFSWSRHHDVTGALVGYWISDAGLAQHLIANYGLKCGDKRIWREVFTWAPEHRELVLKTACFGDGSAYTHTANTKVRKTPNTIENYTSKSEGLADDIQELCIGLGFGALIHERPPFVNDKGYECSNVFTAGFHRTRQDATARVGGRFDGRHTRIAYKGKVYCATIPESGLLYVRRNKKPVLSGNSNQQPLKGGSEAAHAKRLSGLELHSMLSAGAYKNLREGATLRGQKNDEYWRALRQGYKPRDPGSPFVWSKFQALLQGAGLHARKIDDARMRLGPFTDKDLDRRKPQTIKNGDLVNMATLEPIEGGLFSESLTGSNSWGKIEMPFALPNPAFEGGIRSLLNLTQKQLREIIAGRMELPEELR